MSTPYLHPECSPHETPAGELAPKRGERGSALFVAVLACLMLSAMVVVLFESSTIANRYATMHESTAESAAAAEYGANLAVATITSWLRQDGNSGKDWVYGDAGEALYVSAAGVQSKDQRRFQGVYEGHDFRVMVRSAELAKRHETMPADWLWTPTGSEKLYEITASARARNAGALTAERITDEAVRAVLSFNFQDGWHGGGDLGPLALPSPRNFQPYLAENVVLSGEDHDINKYYVEKFETERIVTPLKLITSTANYFGALGSYWTNGQLTLNYRMEPDTPHANPHRPKTPTFGTSSDNRAMWVADPARPYDTYLLGGKQSKTVTIDENVSIGNVRGRINETSTGQANPGGNFNVVLGAFEDLRNLYINMAGVVGSYTDPTNWWQMYVGQYTHSRRPATGIAVSLPNYGGSRVRAQTVHLMKNADGDFLVRLYAKQNGAKKDYYKYPVSGSTWTGYYAWAPATYGASGLILNRNVNPSGTIPGERSGQVAVARTFFWQELVGFQLVRRRETNSSLSDPNEPAIVTQRDVPADGSQRIDKRTIYRVDGDGNRIPAGFDEIYQAHSGAGVSGNTSDSKHPLYGTKYNAISPGYLQDRFDSIYVWNNDGTVEEKADMGAFLFEKDFGVDAEGNPIKRDALALFISYEDQRETTADYNYTDMMFTIYIAPATEQKIIPYTMFTLLTDQWWEQNPDNGLTGRPSHPALVTNKDPSTLEAEDPLMENFNLLGYSPKTDPDDPDSVSFEDQVYSMKVADAGIMKDGQYYHRAKFEEDGHGGIVFSPDVDENGIAILDERYYYTEDDVNNFLIHEWNAGNKDVATAAGREEAKARFLQLIAGYPIYPMPGRWDPPSVSKPILSGDATTSAYQVTDSTASFRQIAADILGFKFQEVPVVKTHGYAPLTAAGAVTPTATSLAFLAGEMVQDPDDGETLSPLPGIGIAHRVREIAQPDGSKTPMREFVAENEADAVNMAYRNYYADDPDTEKEVEGIYGVKDKRFSIGFHRSGPDERFDDRYSRDHYEVVSMGKLGFNPFMEATASDRYIAKNSDDDPDGEEKPVYKYEFKYGKDRLVPDFVFDRPIDGAGILVINGNLVVEDVFAYYGLLMVMGDVVVRPTYKPDRFVYGPDGNPTDAYGNSLYRNAAGKWVYQWMDPDDSANVRESDYVLDDDGERLRDADGGYIPVAPQYATGAAAYQARLVTQGSLLVNGRVVTERVQDPDTGEYIAGELRCFASDAATGLSNDLSGVKKDIAKVVSWNNAVTAADAPAVNRLWSGEE